MNAKIEQTIRKGTIDCPDCGQRANSKTIVNHDYDGYIPPDAGYFLTIECENCGYYEFGFFGPDV